MIKPFKTQETIPPPFQTPVEERPLRLKEIKATDGVYIGVSGKGKQRKKNKAPMGDLRF